MNYTKVDKKWSISERGADIFLATFLTLGLGIREGVESKGELDISSPSLSTFFDALGGPPKDSPEVKELNTK